MQAEELLREIWKIITEYNKHTLDEFGDDTLSRLAYKLAGYKATLGPLVAETSRELVVARHVFQEEKAKRYKELRDEGLSQGDSSDMKRIGLLPQAEDHAEAESLHDKYNKLYYDIGEIVDVLKSELIRRQSERKESRYGG